VYDVGQDEVIGVAVRTSRPFEWRTIRFEGTVERVFRTAAIRLAAASVGDPGPDPATVPDEAATMAGFALSPGRLVEVAYKAAVHVAAYSLVPGFPAAVVERIAEAALAEVLPKRHERAIRTIEVLAVAYDIEQGRQTELVEKLTLGELAGAVEKTTAGIPEPAAIEEPKPARVLSPQEFRRMRGPADPGGLPRSGTEIRQPALPAPPPPRPPDRTIDEPRRRRLRDPGGGL
jgi:hypothetical protein